MKYSLGGAGRLLVARASSCVSEDLFEDPERSPHVIGLCSSELSFEKLGEPALIASEFCSNECSSPVSSLDENTTAISRVLSGIGQTSSVQGRNCLGCRLVANVSFRSQVRNCSRRTCRDPVKQSELLRRAV